MAPSGQETRTEGLGLGRERVWLQDIGGEDRGKEATWWTGKQGSLGKQPRGLNEARPAENQRPEPPRGQICNSDIQRCTWLETGFMSW